MSTVCLILARGGSKRIPKKNLRKLAGKPLISYTIEAAKESRCFKEIVLSTDDHEIREIGIKHEIVVDDRPSALGGDLVKAVDVIQEFVGRRTTKMSYENVAMLLPTCPFRTAEDIKNACQLFDESAKDLSLVAVSAYEFPPQLALKKSGNENEVEMLNKKSWGVTTRSQDISKLYHPNGAIYISSIKKFIETGSFFSEKMLCYEMPQERSFDIDYPFQLKIADLMAQENNK